MSPRFSRVELIFVCVFLAIVVGIIADGSLIGGTSIDIDGHYKQLMVAQDVIAEFPKEVDTSIFTNNIGTGSADDKGNAYFFITHFVNSLVGNESFMRSVSASHEAVVIRNLVMGLIGVLGAFTCAFFTWAISRSIRTAVTAALLLLSIPIWTSSLYINPRDPVIAVGYTMLTAGLSITRVHLSEFLYLQKIPSFLVGAGLFLSVGTRLSMWLICALTIIFSFLLNSIRYDWRSVFVRSRQILPPLFAATALIFVTNPQMWYQPLTYIINVTRSSSNFSAWGGKTLLLGNFYPGQQAPWFYFPVWIFAQTPILIVIILIGATVAFIKKFRQVHVESLFLLMLQMTLVPALLTLNNSVVYNGSRVVMFIFPAIVIFGCLGIHIGLSKCLRFKLYLNLIWVFAIIPLTDNLRLFPYGYTYINPAARLIGGEDHWELDFFGLSRWDPKVIGSSLQPVNWPASESIPTPKLSYRWLDPNIMPSPVGCERNYVLRKVLLREFRFGYLSKCDSISQRDPVFALTGCSPKSFSECIPFGLQELSGENSTVSVSNPTLKLTTYQVQVCTDLEITTRSEWSSGVETKRFALVTTQLNVVNHPSSSGWLYKPMGLSNSQSSETTLNRYSGWLCFDVPDEFAWKDPGTLALQYSTLSSTLQWTFQFIQPESTSVLGE